MNDNKQLADILFPYINDTPIDIEKKYPKRMLAQDACVTRFAPSPTGFIHLGNLYSALASERLAHTTHGIFYLRIEDTDRKREVAGGREYIISCLAKYNVNFDEGLLLENELGVYGPYIQSQRVNIYQVYAKYLVSQGLAYPCFCTEDDLECIRNEQEQQNAKFFGYFGKWAIHRNYSIDRISEELKSGKSFTLRFKSCPTGDVIKWSDGIRGMINITENEHDFILLKSDGVPTYHFAHVVDDYLMGTTYVVRGEEWLSSLPMHIQLFQAFGWETPNYAHISPIMKFDAVTNNKRKLSKRKDSEAAVMFYEEQGFPSVAVIEYLMSVMNSGFDQWRMSNLNLPYSDFPFSIEKMCVSGAVFDIDKLKAISRNVISKLDLDSLYNEISLWLEIYDNDFFKVFTLDECYSKKVLEIAYKNKEKPRKDIAMWSEVKDVYAYFYDILFYVADNYQISILKDVAAKVLTKFCDIYNFADDAKLLFEKIKDLATSNGFAISKTEYKNAPESYCGTVSDVAALIRYAVTGRYSSPDLYDIFIILGEGKVKQRCIQVAKKLVSD